MTVPWDEALVAFALSLLAVLAGTPVFLRAARPLGLLDAPNARSAHTRLTPRGGGVVVLLGAALAVAVCGPPPGRAAAAVLGAVALVALGGLADDRLQMAAAPKFAIQGLAAAVVVAVAGGLDSLPLPAPADVPLGRGAGAFLAWLWLVAVVNFYNFLDGIDGLAGLQGVVTGAGIALAAWDGTAAVGAAALAGGCLGFLVFNWSPARVFLGDAGSGLLGFAFAALPLLAPDGQRGPATLFVALSIWLFLADGFWTMTRRLVRGRPVWEAHREHVYQRLVAAGLGHAPVATLVGAGSALLTGTALVAWRLGDARLLWAALAMALALFGLELLALARRGGGNALGAAALGNGEAGLG